MPFAHLQNVGICSRREEHPLLQKRRNSSNLPVPFAQPTGSCAPASSRRSPVLVRSAASSSRRRRGIGGAEGGGPARRKEGGTTREGRPCLDVPAPGLLFVVLAADAASLSSSHRRGWGPAETVRAGEDGNSGPPWRRDLLPAAPHLLPRRRVLPRGSAPATWAGGRWRRRPASAGGGRWGQVAETAGEASSRPPAWICRGHRLLTAPGRRMAVELTRVHYSTQWWMGSPGPHKKMAATLELWRRPGGRVRRRLWGQSSGDGGGSRERRPAVALSKGERKGSFPQE
jgi:hypothetical protein